MNLPRKFIITSEKFDYWYNFEQIQHQNSLGYFIIHYMSKKFLTFPSKQTSSFQEEIWLLWNIEQKQQNSLGGFTIHFISKSSSFQKEKLIKKHESRKGFSMQVGYYIIMKLKLHRRERNRGNKYINKWKRSPEKERITIGGSSRADKKGP